MVRGSHGKKSVLADCKQMLNSRVNLLQYCLHSSHPAPLSCLEHEHSAWRWRKGDHRAWEGAQVFSDFLGGSGSPIIQPPCCSSCICHPPQPGLPPASDSFSFPLHEWWYSLCFCAVFFVYAPSPRLSATMRHGDLQRRVTKNSRSLSTSLS